MPRLREAFLQFYVIIYEPKRFRADIRLLRFKLSHTFLRRRKRLGVLLALLFQRSTTQRRSLGAGERCINFSIDIFRKKLDVPITVADIDATFV